MKRVKYNETGVQLFQRTPKTMTTVYCLSLVWVGSFTFSSLCYSGKKSGSYSYMLLQIQASLLMAMKNEVTSTRIPPDFQERCTEDLTFTVLRSHLASHSLPKYSATFPSRNKSVWVSTFLTLWPFSPDTCVAVIPTIKLCLLLLHNCTFTTIMTCTVNICVFKWLSVTLQKNHWNPKGVVTHKLRTTDIEANKHCFQATEAKSLSSP